MNVGDRITPQEFPIRRVDLVRYAGASGDFNPIHADPTPARKAGFGRPILHGLCTMGIATRTLLQQFAPGEPERLRSMFVRFSKPVPPPADIALSAKLAGAIGQLQQFEVAATVDGETVASGTIALHLTEGTGGGA